MLCSWARHLSLKVPFSTQLSLRPGDRILSGQLPVLDSLYASWTGVNRLSDMHHGLGKYNYFTSVLLEIEAFNFSFQEGEIRCIEKICDELLCEKFHEVQNECCPRCQGNWSKITFIINKRGILRERWLWIVEYLFFFGSVIIDYSVI